MGCVGTGLVWVLPHKEILEESGVMSANCWSTSGFGARPPPLLDTISLWISACPIDISAWINEHHFELNLKSPIQDPGNTFATLSLKFIWSSKPTSSQICKIRKIRHIISEHTLCPGTSFPDCTAFKLTLMHVHSNLSKWSSMQRHIWSSMNPREWTLSLSFFYFTGSQLLPSSSSRHWGLHTEKSLYLHPSNYTHLKMFIISRNQWSVHLLLTESYLHLPGFLPQFKVWTCWR